jgi:Flp pilus assembly protein TadD
LGLVLAAAGRLDESFQAFSKVVGPAAAHSNLGVLLAKQGRYDQARQAFHQALALDATLPQPKAFLAYLDRPQPDR